MASCMVIGHRYNSSSLLHGTLHRYYSGFDYFFFDSDIACAALEHAMPFAMGLPWWDIWLPCVGMFKGRQIVVVDLPGIVHLMHPPGFSSTAWRDFAHIFSDYVIAESDNPRRPLPQLLTDILPFCRGIAALPHEGAFDEKDYRQRVSELGNLFLTEIRKGVVSWMDGDTSVVEVQSDETARAPENALNIENIFRRFEQRHAAGDTVVKVDEILKQNRLAAIGADLLDALAGAPEDSDVCLLLGEIAIRRGEYRTGYDLLCKVLETKPKSIRTLRLLGIASVAIGRSAEGIEYLAEVLRLSPGDRAIHNTLARALWDANHRGEALELIDRTLAQWPDFSPAVELRRRFGAEFEKSSSNLSRSWIRPIRRARVTLRRWLRHSN
jgi:hypothetical protein